MLVEYCGSEFDVPDLAIDRFEKDFNALPGSGCRESICQLRDCIEDILGMVAEEPDMLEDRGILEDFIRALAMRQAMQKLGILHDS